MSEWMKRLIGKHTVECFSCKKVVDKKTAFIVKLDTAEGLIEINSCESCAKELDEILKAIEDIHNDIAR